MVGLLDWLELLPPFEVLLDSLVLLDWLDLLVSDFSDLLLSSFEEDSRLTSELSVLLSAELSVSELSSLVVSLTMLSSAEDSTLVEETLLVCVCSKDSERL
ncbi:hypothetical protein IJ707_03790, partial [bacterium]|nr:hypothetical protein [bacterium]